MELKINNKDFITFKKNDVIPFKKIGQLTLEDIEVYKTESHISQSRIITRDIVDSINLAYKTGKSNLVEIACLTPEANLYKNIIVNLVVKYKVQHKDILQLSNKIYQYLVKENRYQFAQLKRALKTKIDNIALLTFHGAQREIMQNNHGNVNSKSSISAVTAVIEVDKDKQINEITDKIMKNYLSNNFAFIEKSFNLELKTTYSENHEDICILSNESDAKSSLLKYQLSQKDINEYIVYSPNDFDNFPIPAFEAKQAKFEKNSLIITKDWSSILWNEVLVLIESLGKDRPNIICNSKDFNYALDHILNKENLKSVIIYDNHFMIDFFKNFDSTTNQSHVETSKINVPNKIELNKSDLDSLFNSSAQKELISVPSDVTTFICKSVEEASNPLIIASVDKIENKITIYNLGEFIDFLSEKNIKKEIANSINSIYNTKSDKKSVSSEEIILSNSYPSLITHPLLMVQSIIDLASGAFSKYNSYNIVIYDELNRKPYARLVGTNNENSLNFYVTNKDIFNKVMSETSYSSDMLKYMLYQIESDKGNRPNSSEKLFEHMRDVYDAELKNDVKKFSVKKIQELGNMLSEDENKVENVAINNDFKEHADTVHDDIIKKPFVRVPKGKEGNNRNIVNLL